MIEWAAYALCGAGIALPTIPGLLQLRTPRNEPVKIDPLYTRDPRYLGRSFRNALHPVIDTGVTGRMPFLKRNNEFAMINDDIDLPEHALVQDVLLSRGALRTGARAILVDAYAHGEVAIGPQSTVRALAADASTTIGARTTVTRWVDVDGDMRAGEYCDLGVSTSATGTLTLNVGTRFHRLYAMPVAVATAMKATPSRIPDDLRGSTLVVKSGATFDGDAVAPRDVIIGQGAVVNGTVTCGGSLYVGAGAHILGNLIARRDIILGSGATVSGHAFSDGTIEVGPNVVVGTSLDPKTVQSTQALYLGPGAKIFGWVICERGGITAGAQG